MKKWAPYLLPWVLGATLLASAVIKAHDPTSWYLNLSHYRLLPETWVRVLTWYVPALEGLVGLSLLSGRLLKGAWLLTIAFGLAFCVFIGSAWARHLDISCGCFGGTLAVGPASFLKALLFLVLAFLGARRLLGSQSDTL